MRIQPFATQLRRLLVEYEREGSIFGIHRSLFYTPAPGAPFAVPSLFGARLATPVGPSAGPHTQLSQNIVSAWLCGGRFIELKTVQVKDDLAIPRPCIDMTDEGYNVEWSQELSLEESAHEYVTAWALIHLLPRILGWEEAAGGPGTIFDMSVGYTLEGLGHPRMTRFMDVMADASEQIAVVRATLARDFPHLADVAIPPAIVNSVTLSTMHGCPPAEIEGIARYLLEQRGLHTVVKLNPTLLGKDAVLDILHGALGFTEIEIPDAVFEHDLQYDRAVALITALKQAAGGCGRTFGVKLSNTLAVRNHAGRLPGGEMYMSGRALYPVTVALYERLLRQFGGDLHVSYSGGADADNVASILACGALPVTGCSDLLKPGGVARMRQWLENLQGAMAAQGVASLEEWSHDRLRSVRAAAADAVSNPRYRKGAFPHGLPKVESRLDAWDCIVAPCAAACAVHQDVPEYAGLIARGEYDRALAVILARNPLPGVTGHVCTHLCQARCTRNGYDESVAIRALKRVAEARGQVGYAVTPASSGRKVAIVGSGPSGLAAAAFLALNGVQAVIFEARDVPGGMMRLVPPFRLPQEIIDRDITRITDLGVEIRLNTPVARPPEELLADGYDAVYLASGFQRDAPLRIPGAQGPGVVPALHLLDLSRRGQRLDLGRKAVVIGGGDTAMDAARTACRITRHPVTLLYRRTRREMPACIEELEGALAEGVQLEELTSPVAVMREHGRVTGLRCVRNRLGAPGADGRRVPEAIAGSEFVVPCDSVIVAIGQRPELAFLDASTVTRHEGGGLAVDATTGGAGRDRVYAGGDVVVEPGSIISACADGRRAAEAICARLGVAFREPAADRPVLSDDDIIRIKAVRARRLPQVAPATRSERAPSRFDLIDATLTGAQATTEAERCLQCSSFCDKCVEVCPNRANYTFRLQPVAWELPLLLWRRGGLLVAGVERFAIAQVRQIVHVDDFCNECDNCQTFCVHRGRPYADKPRLFLDPASFAGATDNAFQIEGRMVRRREKGADSRLVVLDDGGMTFEDEFVHVRLSDDWQVAEAAAKQPFEGTRSLRTAAEMAVLLRGITRSLPFLLRT